MVKHKVIFIHEIVKGQFVLDCAILSKHSIVGLFVCIWKCVIVCMNEKSDVGRCI